MDKLLLVIPVCRADVDLCLKNLELCQRFDGLQPITCIIHHPDDFDPTGVIQEAKKCFQKIHLNKYPEWKGERNWPYPANWAWQEAVRCISGSHKKPWFWWEADATPLRPQWFKQIADAYVKGGKPFAGHVVRKASPPHYTYMQGVGCYPPNLTDYCTQAMLVRRFPFDIIAGQHDGVVPNVAPINHLIATDPEHRSVSFYEKSELEALLATQAVLFHHCKDGSLYQHLTGRPGPVRVAEMEVKSSLEQTNWESGQFSFPPYPNTVYFNCSLLHRDHTFYLFARRFRFPNGPGTQPAHNDLAIWRLSKHMAAVELSVPQVPRRYEREQWEDPRVIPGPDGAVYVGFATWVHLKPWTIRQSLTKLSPNWQTISVVYEPDYGGNARSPDRGTRHEKNWLWFLHDNAWHCIYTTNPMVVFRMNPNNANIAKVYKNRQLPVPWTYGELRGGSTPVRVGNEYWTFFHSSMAWRASQRRYFMGCLAFQAEPPFELTRMTVEPLLTGSDRDSRAFGGPLVIFPCGAVLMEKEWVVTFGVNDEACGWIKIPHKELEKLLFPIERQPGLMERATNAIKEAVGV